MIGGVLDRVATSAAAFGPCLPSSDEPTADVLSPAVSAFDAIACDFDARFGSWLSVSAQRRAVRRILESAFPYGSSILEIGGGTGEDAAWLLERGYEVLLTDPSPRMVRAAREKLRRFPRARAIVAAAETLSSIGTPHELTRTSMFDGAFSNFAALNCVDDLSAVARGLASLVRPNGTLVVVLFGSLSPGEIVVELARLRPRSAFRRLAGRWAAARLSGREFRVHYHRKSDIARAMSPWFRMIRSRGIGVFVPPSAAEPWISQHPHLLGALAALDRLGADRLAPFGDHVLYQLERTAIPAPGQA